MPLASKGKGRGRDARQSRSRNTTPSSGLSASTATGASFVPGYLDHDVSKFFSPSTVQYADILERLGGGGTIPESKTLELLIEHLKTLSKLAEERGDFCNAGMRELSQKRKEVLEVRREQEQMERDAEDRWKMKREAEEDEDGSRALKGGKFKKRKERASREDRPLAVGAHEVTRQDGGEFGRFCLVARQYPDRSLTYCDFLRSFRRTAISLHATGCGRASYTARKSYIH
jgi:transcriptional adapter 3